MKPFSSRILVLLAGLLLAATPGSGAPAATATSRALASATRTKERINTLLRHRLNPDPLPVSLPNPFLVAGGAAIAEQPDPAPAGDPVPKTPVELPPGSDAEALARYIATLKIGGTLELNGRMQLIINQSPYKEGDLIFLDNRNAVTYLQVIRITPTELTLGLNQAVQTIKLKGPAAQVRPE